MSELNWNFVIASALGINLECDCDECIASHRRQELREALISERELEEIELENRLYDDLREAELESPELDETQPDESIQFKYH